jgi:hypothetical protein
MNSLEERKKELLVQSEACRRVMAVEIQNVKASMLWIPRTVQTIRKVSPFLVWGAPLLGVLIGRRISMKPRKETSAPRDGRKGLLATVLGGIALYRKAKPVLDVVLPLLRKTNLFTLARKV